MQPKSGKAPNPVKPAAPAAADPADSAQAGGVAEIERTPVDPPLHEAEEAEELTWIEVELVGEDDSPIAGERCRITHPDGRVAIRTTNSEGLIRMERIPAGTYRICFLDLDEEAWEPA